MAFSVMESDRLSVEATPRFAADYVVFKEAVAGLRRHLSRGVFILG